MTEPLIQVENLSYKYEQKFVLENVSFRIEKGSFVGIVGPNGSGKTTLLKLLLGLLPVQNGTIHLFGEQIQDFHNWVEIGFVSQKANAFNSGFPATVLEVVLSGLVKKRGWFRFYTNRDREKAMETLQVVEMAEYAKQPIGELSGGQQQRVFIARALIQDPEVLILDEPTVGIDARRVDAFYSLLESLHKDYGKTLLMVTHDIGTVSRKVGEVLCLNRTLHFHGDAKEFRKLEAGDIAAIYGQDVVLLSHSHEHGGDHS
ncbi:metal ABC transporter ATP-binding protein [Bacillus fonticola]|uniref:metal ABC transporter ATP-binding protein n=1 Tax=Bacillus fonticola TaxID=2728853 RepID=UPI0014767687|nr:metal ABC transporter ATP-binding protein [Bacillus fonticola]